MDFEITFPVYCHDLINPPAHDRDCNIDLDVTDTTLIQFVKEKRTAAGTKYLLTILHPKSTGFTSYEQHELDNFILAFNMLLKRVCMTSRYSNFSILSLKAKKALQSSTVARTNNKVFVDIVDEVHVAIRDEVHVTVTVSDRIEEGTILEAFRNLQKFKMSEIKSNSSLRENDLKKSLQYYSSGMEQENIVLKYRDLFTALEVCTNIDGTERKDGPFDNEVCNLSGTNPNTVERWRLFL